MIRRPPRSTRVRSSAASDVYKRQGYLYAIAVASSGVLSGTPVVSSGLTVYRLFGGVPRQVASHGRSCVGGRWFVVDKAGLSLSKPLLETTKADTGICTTM